MLRSVLHALLDLVLPQRHDVRRFDTLTVLELAVHGHAKIFHTQVQCYAPLRYASPLVRACVHAAKYHGHSRAATLLGESMAPHVAEILAEQSLFGLYEHPIIIPIPLHQHRLRERGYNQSERIASVIALLVEEKPLMCRTDVLARIRNTPAQAKLLRRKRLKNMEYAFRVEKPIVIQGEDIVLIDDVATTGATMSAARDALLQSGARTVLCVAVAH